MRMLNTVLCASALSCSTLSFATDCEELWKKVETARSEKELRGAEIAINTYSASCLKEDDAERNRVIAKNKCETYLEDIEYLADIDSNSEPTALHAHTTSECMLRDHQRDIKDLEDTLKNFAKSHFFKDLEQDDVDSYLARLNMVDTHIDQVLDGKLKDIRSACIKPVNNLIGKYSRGMTVEPDYSETKNQLDYVVDATIAATERSVAASKNTEINSKITKLQKEFGPNFANVEQAANEVCKELGLYNQKLKKGLNSCFEIVFAQIKKNNDDMISLLASVKTDLNK